MKLAIVGSQILGAEQARLVWPLITGLILYWEPEEIISGGATGVDSIAEAAARRLEYSERDEERRLIIYRPEREQWEPNGYRDRNQQIVERLSRPYDRLIRISRRLNQYTYGSGWTADRAEEVLGADGVHRYYI